jgi:predicted Zn-dependent peptidase
LAKPRATRVVAPTADAQHQLHELEGGARLLVAERRDRLSASLVLMFGVGSRHESEELGGISHFIEHLVFKGTERRPSARAVAEAIEGVGGVLNAWTDKEATAYWAKVPASRSDLAIDVLLDLVSGPRLVPEEVERERTVVLEELKMYLDQPQDYVQSLFEEAMWPGHPLGRDVIGTAESVARLSAVDARAHLEQHYCRRNLVLAVAGDVDGSALREDIERQLTLPVGRADEVAGNDAPGELTAPGVRRLRRKTEQAHVCLGLRGCSYRDPDREILDLIATVLGDGMSSRLFQDLREERGLVYDVHSYTSKHRDSGYMAVELGVEPTKTVAAIEAAVEQVRRLIDESLPEDELGRVKEYTKGRLVLGLEGTNSLASWMGQQQLLMGGVRPIEDKLARIDAIEPGDIARVAKEILTRPIQLAVIGPFASDAPFLRAIS